MKLSVECDCGAVRGDVDTKHLHGYRAVCLCDDCQAFAHYLKRGDTLDTNGGTDIIPMMPSHYVFTSGFERMECVRLSNTGMYRWYANCCKTPMGNAMSPSMAYIGVPSRIFLKMHSAEQVDKVFGPIRERMQARFALGALPPLAQKKVSLGFMLRVVKFMLVSKLTGAGKPTPFFDSKGEPVKSAHILSQREREELRPLCGKPRNDI